MLKRVGLASALETGGFPDEAVDAYVALLRDTDTMRNELLSGGARFMTLRGLDPATLLSDDDLARVSAPTLMLWGEDDPFGTPEVARSVAGRLPHAQLEIVRGAGHAVWMDDAAQIAEATSAFLKPAG